LSERSDLRLIIVGIIVFSLLVTLLGRLYYLQVVTGDTYRVAAANNTVREIVTPAARGLILDQAGRPLIANRTSLVVTVDRAALQRQPNGGADVITGLY